MLVCVLHVCNVVTALSLTVSHPIGIWHQVMHGLSIVVSLIPPPVISTVAFMRLSGLRQHIIRVVQLSFTIAQAFADSQKNSLPAYCL